MKRSYLEVALVVLLSFLLNNCAKKEEEEEHPKIYLNQELKDWMFFDTASWWIYKETNTGHLDTQVVKESKIFFIYPDFNNPIPVVDITIQYAHVKFKDRVLLFSSDIELWTIRGSTPLIFFPLEVGTFSPNYGSEIKSIDNNYTLDNKYFNTMVTVYNRKADCEGGDEMEYKILKGVGIINKKNITRNENWQLIDYDVKMNKN